MNIYNDIKNKYSLLGVDVEKALEVLGNTPISIQCWQGDDINGFYQSEGLSGGIQVTGNYPYKANNVDELRQDLDVVFKLVPGKHRLNLHAIYLDTKEDISLDKIEPKHFKTWVEYAKKNNIGLDFNPTLFAHEMAKSGFTISSSDEVVRNFWIRHAIQSRRIGQYFSEELDQKTVVNLWIPDGYKDFPFERLAPRARLKDALDQIFEEKLHGVIDTLEPKLFGIGAEGYTTGTMDFYLGYAVKNDKSLCIDTGHFHPTEHVGDKLSSISLFTKNILLHVTRNMRWDSDHVVSYDDSLLQVMESLVRDELLDKTFIGLDFFDASINRVAAWVIGIRNTQKALLKALLEPKDLLQKVEKDGDYTSRLAILEELKTYPVSVIYDEFCKRQNTPTGMDWLEIVKTYENTLKGRK